MGLATCQLLAGRQEAVPESDKVGRCIFTLWEAAAATTKLSQKIGRRETGDTVHALYCMYGQWMESSSPYWKPARARAHYCFEI